MPALNRFFQGNISNGSNSGNLSADYIQFIFQWFLNLLMPFRAQMSQDWFLFMIGKKKTREIMRSSFEIFLSEWPRRK